MSSTHSATVMASQVQLPIWPEEMRGLPNAFARSALFTVANARKGVRSNFKRKRIASVNGVTITYTGEELRQDDEDVFLQILHVSRYHELGSQDQGAHWLRDQGTVPVPLQAEEGTRAFGRAPVLRNGQDRCEV